MEKCLYTFIKFKKTVSASGRSSVISCRRPLLGSPESELRIILSIASVVVFFLELVFVRYWHLGWLLSIYILLLLICFGDFPHFMFQAVVDFIFQKWSQQYFQYLSLPIKDGIYFLSSWAWTGFWLLQLTEYRGSDAVWLLGLGHEKATTFIGMCGSFTVSICLSQSQSKKIIASYFTSKNEFIWE